MEPKKMNICLLKVFQITRLKRFSYIISLMLLLGGCICVRPNCQQAVELTQHCPTVRIEMFFGLSKGQAETITASDWNKFVDSVITPKFPNGLSIYDASGQWKDSTGTIIKEGTKVVLIVSENNDKVFSSIDEIRTAYKKQFDQESVMLIFSCADARF
jgi:hypothetical protein